MNPLSPNSGLANMRVFSNDGYQTSFKGKHVYIENLSSSQLQTFFLLIKLFLFPIDGTLFK
jgi:hypothetical protein